MLFKCPKAGTRSPFLLISYFVAWAAMNYISVSGCATGISSPFSLLYLLGFKITKSKVKGMLGRKKSETSFEEWLHQNLVAVKAQ